MNRSQEIIRLLRSNPSRKVYEAGTPDGERGNGEYYVTYTGSDVYKPFAETDVLTLLRDGIIEHQWPDKPHLHYYKVKKLP